ncbi:MAG: siderophore ABC transporter substrate-binding protein [Roseburia sp.]
MKKIVSMLLVAAMALSVAACGSTAADNTGKQSSAASNTEMAGAVESTEMTEAATTVTLTTRNGAGETVEVEFPANPSRLAVMDLGALDILDNIGYGDRIVGVAKGSSIDYLQKYVTNDEILNLGTVKEADMEALLESEPDVIFIGGRMSAIYDELVKIAPVYMVYTDLEIGVVESTAMNAKNIASLFGAEDQIDARMEDYTARIEALQAVAEGKTAIVGMVNAGGYGLLGNDGRCSIIGREIGFENVGVDANVDTSAHGNEASFEFVLDKNPDYIFAMDRDAAIGTEGAQLAAEVLDNELVNKTDAAKNGNVIVLEHSNVWYTAEGGITALGTMLSDLESALIK